jgi:titin
VFGYMTHDNRLGGVTAPERNVIADNRADGVSLWDSGTMSNTIAGNYIGLNANGTVALGNRSHGVSLARVSSNTIGGVTSAAGNIISGNGEAGIGISGVGTTGNTIANNAIGVGSDPKGALGNAWGIACWLDAERLEVQNNTFADNLIAGNRYNGIHLDGWALVPLDGIG